MTRHEAKSREQYLQMSSEGEIMNDDVAVLLLGRYEEMDDDLRKLLRRVRALETMHNVSVLPEDRLDGEGVTPPGAHITTEV